MATITADLPSPEGYRVEIRSGRHVWYADEPVEAGGGDTGPDPYALLLSAVASCTCITLTMYCRRKGWALQSISARYTHDKVHARDCDDCGEHREGVIDRVRSEIFIEGDFDEDQRARLSEIARRCPVHRTIEKGVAFTCETVFVG